MALTFTDDDLKRLKEICGSYGLPIHSMGKHKFKALLARLEAAELAMRDPDDCNCYEKEYWHMAAISRWRKAAGK